MNKKVFKILMYFFVLVVFVFGANIAIGSVNGNQLIKLPKASKDSIIKNVKTNKKSTRDKQIDKYTKSEITLTCWGDYMNHITQIRDAKKVGYDFSDSFKVIKNIVDKSDLSFVNLETTIAKSEDNISGYPAFATHKNVIKALKDTGFDVISTSNNHSMDKGFKGIDSTIDEIKANNLLSTGTFKENETTKPLILNSKGIRIGFFAATEHINGLENRLLKSDRPDSINLINLDKIKKI